MATASCKEAETEQYSGLRLGERVAGSFIKVERHIILTNQFASDNFADLKLNISLLDLKLFFDKPDGCNLQCHQNTKTGPLGSLRIPQKHLYLRHI